LATSRYYSVHRKTSKPSTVKLKKLIEEYSQFSPSPISLRQFIDFAQRDGDEKRSYLFLRQEIPTRLANMVKEMIRLPSSLLKMPSTKLVTSWYETSFDEVIKFQRTKPDHSTLIKFHDTMGVIVRRHRNVVETMAAGILEWRENNDQVEKHRDKVQYFLDRFYTSRIGIRILINQHILLFGNERKTPSNNFGAIDPHCDVIEVVNDAYEDAKNLCENYYLSSPEIQINVQNSVEKSKEVDIIYVPSHLHHICFELFKNAMRASMEVSDNNELDEIPKIKVTVTKGDHDCCIRISDMGGGASRQVVMRWMEYLYSTAPPPSANKSTRVAPLAGYGYGLPLSRLYARYLGGDLNLQSLEGYGTDAFIYLKTYSKEAVETVPVFNAAVTEHYSRPMLGDDWVIPANQSRKDNPFIGSKR